MKEQQGRHVQGWLISGFLAVIACDCWACPQDDDARRRAFFEAAKVAIQDEKECVLVADVESSERCLMNRTLIVHKLSVISVVKPFQRDDKAYYIPLCVAEDSVRVGGTLGVGKRYIIVINAVCTLYIPALRVTASIELCSGDEVMIVAKLLDIAKTSGKYGSSGGLIMSIEVSNANGVITPNRDGFLEPDEHGLGVGTLRTMVSEGCMVWVVRAKELRERMSAPSDCLCEIIEDLTKGAPPPRVVWIRHADTYWKCFNKEQLTRAPYRPYFLVPGYHYVVVVESKDGRLVLRAVTIVLNPRDLTVDSLRKRVDEVQEERPK